MSEDSDILKSLRSIYRLLQKFADPAHIEEGHIPIESFTIYENWDGSTPTTVGLDNPIARLLIANQIPYGATESLFSDELIREAAELYAAVWHMSLSGEPRFQFLRAIHMGARIGDVKWKKVSKKDTP